MRYKPDHKAKTRAKIIKQASALFRKRGYHAVSVDAVMAAAKLTHGGFYHHFRSKDHLFREVLSNDYGLLKKLKDRSPSDNLKQQGLAILLDYVAPEHVGIVGPDCTMAALANDAARGSPQARKTYTDRIKNLASEIARSEPSLHETDPQVLRAAVLTIGGMVLARASSDPAFTEQLLDACGEGIKSELSQNATN